MALFAYVSESILLRASTSAELMKMGRKKKKIGFSDFAHFLASAMKYNWYLKVSLLTLDQELNQINHVGVDEQFLTIHQSSPF